MEKFELLTESNKSTNDFKDFINKTIKADTKEIILFHNFDYFYYTLFVFNDDELTADNLKRIIETLITYKYDVDFLKDIYTVLNLTDNFNILNLKETWKTIKENAEECIYLSYDEKDINNTNINDIKQTLFNITETK